MQVYSNIGGFTFSTKLKGYAVPVRIVKYSKDNLDRGMVNRFVVDENNPDKIVHPDLLEIVKDHPEDKYVLFEKRHNAIDMCGFDTRNYFLDEDFKDVLDFIKPNFSEKQIALLEKKFPNVNWKDKSKRKGLSF